MDPVPAVNALTRRWVAASDGRSTVLAGPGVWPLLALLAVAADETARAELETALGVAATEADNAARAVLDTLGAGPAVSFALGLWSRADLPLRKSWLDRVPAGVHGELSGAPGTDQQRLDTWASEHTDGLIERMPVKVDLDTVLVLASALTVRTRWVEPFDDGAQVSPGTGPWAGRRFAALNRTSYDLTAVTLAETPAGPVTQLRVAGTDGIDVHLFLGEPDRSPGDILATGVDLLAGQHPGTGGDALPEGRPGPGIEVGMVSGHDPHDRCRVVLPRFAVSAEHDLLARPDVFGLAALTDQTRGHLPGMSSQPLSLSQARQDAVAAFTAKGFYAAAVTAFGFRVAAAFRLSVAAREVRLTFDRPFGFAAVHRESGLVLVAGWVDDPEAWDPPTA